MIPRQIALFNLIAVVILGISLGVSLERNWTGVAVFDATFLTLNFVYVVLALMWD